MNKFFLLLSSLILIGTSVKAQEDLTSKGKGSPIVMPMKVKPEESKSPAIKIGSNANVSSNSNNNIKSEDQSLLQELYSLEDQRQSLEKNQSISSSERASKIQELNSNYFVTKQKFYNYVSSKGILNISNQEQSYYLSLLKGDGREQDYQEGINLISNSKK